MIADKIGIGSKPPITYSLDRISHELDELKISEIVGHYEDGVYLLYHDEPILSPAYPGYQYGGRTIKGRKLLLCDYLAYSNKDNIYNSKGEILITKESIRNIIIVHNGTPNRYLGSKLGIFVLKILAEYIEATRQWKHKKPVSLARVVSSIIREHVMVTMLRTYGDTPQSRDKIECIIEDYAMDISYILTDCFRNIIHTIRNNPFAMLTAVTVGDCINLCNDGDFRIVDWYRLKEEESERTKEAQEASINS